MKEDPYVVQAKEHLRQIFYSLSMADLAIIQECCERGSSQGLESVQSLPQLNRELVQAFLDDPVGREVVAAVVKTEMGKREEMARIDENFARQLLNHAGQVKRLNAILEEFSLTELADLLRSLARQEHYDLEKMIQDLPIKDKALLGYFFATPARVEGFLDALEEKIQQKALESLRPKG